MPSLFEIAVRPDLIQNQDVISFNLWQVLISLCNLLILFLVLKHFLFKPVKKILAKRKEEVDRVYREAEEARSGAEENRLAWEEKISTAEEEAQGILDKATGNAKRRGEEIVGEARGKAEEIIRQAEEAAELEKTRAEGEIRQEIVDVSRLMTEKLLSREIKEEDHKKLIDSFLSEMGDEQ